MEEQQEQLEVQGTPAPTEEQLQLQREAAEQQERERPQLEAAAAHVREVTEAKAAAELSEREYADGDPVSDSVVGEFAVYDNSELRFWPGLGTYPEREAAQHELDEIRPTTGHDLVVVEV